MNKRFAASLLLLASVLILVLAVPAGAAADKNFRAHLSGGSEVPPVDTLAQGQAVFQLSSDGTELSYRLIVANIEDVLQAHIHMAPAGSNGPVVAWLYPASPPPALIPGRFDGVLAVGTITASDLVGPLAGMTLDALLNALEAGNAYVNVHTVDNPGGEVRGQIY
ncbi:MAG: CHRD domain-containing protein [Thermoleophilia bacterium]